jgi:holo-[acyl-carrier protein] synthase
MMVGIDVVDVARFRALLDRSPGIANRFFTPDELAHCARSKDHALHLAGTLAAKEAVMKALGLVPAVAWARRIEIARSDTGAPVAHIEEATVAVSISHDGPIAAAVALNPGRLFQ